jgi:hypothetical protein
LDDLDLPVGLCSESDVVIYADEKAYAALEANIRQNFLKKLTKLNHLVLSFFLTKWR